MGLTDGLRRLDEKLAPAPRGMAPKNQVLLGLVGLAISVTVLVLSLVRDEPSAAATPLIGFSLAAVLCGVRALRAASRGTPLPVNELYGPLGLGIMFTTFAVVPPLVDAGNRSGAYLAFAAAILVLGLVGIYFGLRRPYRASR